MGEVPARRARQCVCQLRTTATTRWRCTSPPEKEARKNEKKEPPPKLKAQMDEMNKLMIGAPEFFDLKHPWLYSPPRIAPLGGRP
jgi:hypothetical protein